MVPKAKLAVPNFTEKIANITVDGKKSFAMSRYDNFVKRLDQFGAGMINSTPFTENSKNSKINNALAIGEKIMHDYLKAYCELRSQNNDLEPKNITVPQNYRENENKLNPLTSRCSGSMLISAIGDALGAPFEFLERINPNEKSEWLKGNTINDPTVNDNFYLYLNFVNNDNKPPKVIPGKCPRYEETHEIVLFPLNIGEYRKLMHKFENPKSNDISSRFKTRIRDMGLNIQSGMIGAHITTSRLSDYKVCGFYTDDFAQGICLADTLITDGIIHNSNNLNSKINFPSMEFAICVYDWWIEAYGIPYLKYIDVNGWSKHVFNKDVVVTNTLKSINDFIDCVFKRIQIECESNLYSAFGLGGNTKLFINNVKSILKKDDKRVRTDAKKTSFVLPKEISNRMVSGNGSLMRSAPMCALAISTLNLATEDLQNAKLKNIMELAMAQSFVTHGGFAAAQCCAILVFMAQRIAKATIEVQEKCGINNEITEKDLFKLYHDVKQKKLESDSFWLECLEFLKSVWKEYCNKNKIYDEDYQLPDELDTIVRKNTNSSPDKKDSKISDEKTIPDLEADIYKLIKSEKEFNWKRKDNELAEYAFKRWSKDPYYIGSYVCDALHMALNAFYRNDTPYNIMVDACCRGGDADSVGAVVGSLCGACYGVMAMPPNWVAAICIFERQLGEIVSRGIYFGECFKN